MDCEIRGQVWAWDRAKKAQVIKFPAEWSELDRSVSGAFVVETFLDRKWAETPSGFVLANAVITTPIERTYAQVAGEIWFVNCTFRSVVALPYARFARAIRLNGCIFDNDLNMEACCFEEVDCERSANGATTVFKGKTKFHRAKISGGASFVSVTFQGPADFCGVEIEGQLICENTKFLSKDGEANFNTLKVSSHAIFQEATFHGPVDFGSAQIGGEFIFEKASFLSEDCDANFDSAKVSALALFQEATFQGGANFRSARIGGQFSCEKAQFLSRNHTANFTCIKVSALALFKDATFQGPVDFRYAEFSGNLEFLDTKFLSEQGETNFNCAKVTPNAIFTNAVFQGPVDFGYVEIGENLVCHETKFLSEKEKIKLKGLRVGSLAFFTKAVFKGPVDLSHCTFSKSIFLAGAKFSNFVDFSLTSIGDSLFLYSTALNPNSIREAALEPIPTQLPPLADLHGLSYQRSDLHNGDNWRRWVTLQRDDTTYDPFPYLALERCFRRAGLDALADEVHYEMRIAEGQSLKRSGRMPKYLMHQGWRYLVGYGVRGHRIFVLILLIILSSWLFMKFAFAIKGSEGKTFYPFWYTLDLILPAVNLHHEDQWEPVGWIANTFTGLIVLIGWVLIPLAIAQLAGFLKKKD